MGATTWPAIILIAQIQTSTAGAYKAAALECFRLADAQGILIDKYEQDRIRLLSPPNPIVTEVVKESTPWWKWILVGVGAAAVGYVVKDWID